MCDVQMPIQLNQFIRRETAFIFNLLTDDQIIQALESVDQEVIPFLIEIVA